MEKDQNTNPSVWFEIYVNDMTRAKKFYENVFNKKLESIEGNKEIEMWVFAGDMSIYGSKGALVKMPDFPAGNNSVIVYFSSKDCLTEEKRIEKNGGKIIKPKFSIGEHGFISLFIDTESNMIGLHSLQ